MTERFGILRQGSGQVCPKCLKPFRSLTDEHYHTLDPEDFDWPMSYNTHRSLGREHGWPDPGPDRAAEPEPAKEQVIIHRHSNQSREEYDLLQQTARETKHLREMLKEHLQPKKKPNRYQQYKVDKSSK